MNCMNCGMENETQGFRNCESCRKRWREAQRNPDGNAAKLQKMQSRMAKQTNEIAMLLRKLEAVTKDKLALLNDIKWMRGELDENRHFRQKSGTSAGGSKGGGTPDFGGSGGGEPRKLAEVRNEAASKYGKSGGSGRKWGGSKPPYPYSTTSANAD